MAENVFLTVFTALPPITGLLIYLYVRKISIHIKNANWLKLSIGNILVFVFLCSLILLGGEIYYRFIYDTTDSFGLTKVSIDWESRHYKFNNYAVRDSMDYNLKLSGKPRVTFIGDSFTAGHGIANVENRFANKIRSIRPDLEIHVIAYNGWETGDELITLTRLSSAGYEFDNVVLVYILNDISDLMEQWAKAQKRIHSLKPGFLFEHSYFLNILYYHYFAAHDPDISDYYGFVDKAYNGPIWEKQKERLATIKQSMDAANVKFSVVIFPFMHALGPNYKYREIHNKIDAFWKSLNVPYLDLLSVYDSYPASALVVNAHDAHPNELAHTIAAKAINDFLNKNVLKH